MYHILVNAERLKGKLANALNEVKAVFERAGKQFKVHFTNHQGHAREITEELSSSGEKCTVITMGGDGTLHEVINGVKDFENCQIGLIPLGTGNDFAESANIPNDPKRAAEIIAFKAARPIDFIELDNGLRSVNAIGMGIDVDVLKRTYAGKSTGRTKYLKALISSLIKFKSVNFTVKYDGKEEKHYGLIAALGNGKQFGGGIKVFPEAEIDDGYMDLVVVDYLSKFKTVIAFIKLMLGKIHSIKECTHVKCKQATFIPEDKEYTVQAEGELYENIPFNAKIVPQKLKFYLP